LYEFDFDEEWKEKKTNTSIWFLVKSHENDRFDKWIHRLHFYH